MHVERHIVELTTAADGSATGYTPTVTGRVLSLRYVKTDFADGVGFTVTSEATGETIWAEAAVNASASRAPRLATHGSEDGAVAKYAAAGTFVRDYAFLANDRVKIVVASGGDVKTGAVHVVIG